MPSGNIAILTLTVASGGAVAANRFVTQAGAYPAAAAKALGVTRCKADAAGEQLPVDVHGTTIVEVGTGGVAKDAALELDAAGRVVTKASGVAVAKALEAGAAGAFIEVLLVPAA